MSDRPSVPSQRVAGLSDSATSALRAPQVSRTKRAQSNSQLRGRCLSCHSTSCATRLLEQWARSSRRTSHPCTHRGPCSTLPHLTTPQHQHSNHVANHQSEGGEQPEVSFTLLEQLLCTFTPYAELSVAGRLPENRRDERIEKVLKYMKKEWSLVVASVRCPLFTVTSVN